MKQETATVVVERRPGDVFDWVADYRNVPRVLDGVQRWEPVGDQSEGIGAVFDVRIGVLAIGLGIRLQLTEWDRPRGIAFRSATAGITADGRWRFRPHVRGTEVSLTIAYRLPGGGLGDFVARRIEGLMRARVLKALDRMKAAIEERVA
jgi:uncharacterized membrane protein